MKKKVLLIALIGMSFGIKAQDQTINGTTFKTNGNVGIGFTNPTSKLQVAGGILSENSITKGTNGSLWVFDRDITNRFNDSFRVTKSNGSLYFIDRTYSGGFSDFNFLKHSFSNSASSALYLNPKTRLIFQIDKSEVMRINREGNLGIGTTNPGLWKLAVNGKIRAKEIKVETGWSDFVFEKSYNLPTLQEVENHIKEKGHLKDIPSAKEVEKNGIFLGEMDSKLLQKIEELTLYTIQQEKRLNSIELKNEKLEKENKYLKTMNSKLFEIQKRLEKLEIQA